MISDAIGEPFIKAEKPKREGQGMKKKNGAANNPFIKPFGKPIKMQVTIQPYVETVGFNGEDYTHLRFDLQINKTHINQYEPVAWFLVAEGAHRGKREGPEWDALQLYWKKQCDYLEKNIGKVTCWEMLQFCGECAIAHREDWDLKAILAQADLDEIKEWEDKHTTANDKSGAWHWGDRYRFQPHHLVLFYARYLWRRITDTDDDDCDDGSDDAWPEIKSAICTFSRKQHQKMLDKYPEYVKKWNEAREIVKHYDGDEQKELLKEIAGPSIFRFHDDLLEDLKKTEKDEKPPYTKRPIYRPWEIAIVHCARDAWLLNKDGSRLLTSQAASVKRAIDNFSVATGRPKLSIKEKPAPKAKKPTKPAIAKARRSSNR